MILAFWLKGKQRNDRRVSIQHILFLNKKFACLEDKCSLLSSSAMTKLEYSNLLALLSNLAKKSSATVLSPLQNLSKYSVIWIDLVYASFLYAFFPIFGAVYITIL